VTIAEKISAAGVRTAAPKLRRHGIICGLLSAALVVALSTGPAVADQAGPLKTRAGDLSAQIAAGTQRIRQLTLQFQSTSDQSAITSSQLAQAQKQLLATQHQIDANRALLARQAVRAYVEGDSSRPAASPSNAIVGVIVRKEYLALAADNLTETLDQLHLGLRTLLARQSELRQAQEAARQAVSGVAQARQAALAEAFNQQAALDQVNARLREVATEAARSAIRAPRPQVVSAPTPRQGLPVNGGLVAVVVAATAPPPPAAPPAPPSSGGGNGVAGGVWAALRQCESGGNYAENSGNGYFGAYQFSQATWSDLGFPGVPDQEPPAMQDQAAMKLQAQSGWGQWPACAAALGLH
jgi:Transglycosylase-like domain